VKQVKGMIHISHLLQLTFSITTEAIALIEQSPPLVEQGFG